MIIRQVTVTGADDSINPEDLLEISEKYPFVEWGILLSKSSSGQKRFPSISWMEKLNSISDNINLSGHLCGSWLRNNLMSFADISFTNDITLWEKFKRVQLNFHAEKMELTNETLNALRNETWKNKKKFIVQMDDVNNEIYSKLLFGGVLAEPLFDLSHGAGVLPEKWPKVIPSVSPNAYRGYAGGLSCENLKEELVKIEASVGDNTIWIDAETKLRSNNDTLFDLDKVVKFLETAKQYVK